jgi:4-amino-4-deoxy-L-arabinose transferase-like glycosyltransferase
VSPRPTPAIVTQAGVKPIARWALLALCVAYVLPGWLGRSPWKSADIASFGFMMELAQGRSSWLQPTLAGLTPEWPGLLPYWLGALGIQFLGFLPSEVAARVPFALLLTLTLVCTWYSIYFLARDKAAQPVAFAFGGEADPVDYARALADGGLLALMACLGLAQLSHETTPALAQLAFSSLLLFGAAALPYRRTLSWAALALAPAGLLLSGAPAVAAVLLAGVAAVYRLHHLRDMRRFALPVAALALVVLACAWYLQWLVWRVDASVARPGEWQRSIKLVAWFVWPVWPLALWCVWRWRKQIINRHLLLPLVLSLAAVASALVGRASDRALLLGLPMMAALAAFALPTLRRSVASLIDWFTLLFFSSCALIIWVVWFAMVTGVPSKPAANVRRLVPGFEAVFSPWLLLLAALATLAWLALVRWRTMSGRKEIWRSVVLPAGGAILCWLLLMTLWLGLLDHARSYAPMMARLRSLVPEQVACVQSLGLTRAQVAAVQHHAGLRVHAAERNSPCSYLLAAAPEPRVDAALGKTQDWVFVETLTRPSDSDERLHLLRKTAQP